MSGVRTGYAIFAHSSDWEDQDRIMMVVKEESEADTIVERLYEMEDPEDRYSYLEDLGFEDVNDGDVENAESFIIVELPVGGF